MEWIGGDGDGFGECVVKGSGGGAKPLGKSVSECVMEIFGDKADDVWNKMLEEGREAAVKEFGKKNGLIAAASAVKCIMWDDPEN